YLRVRTKSGSVLVLAERPFRGSQELPGHLAVMLVLDAVTEELSPGRHSFRLGGRWQVPPEQKWTLVDRLGAVGLAAGQGPLGEQGVNARLRKDRLAWRSSSEAVAVAVAAVLKERLSEFSQCGSSFSGGPKSDNLAGGWPPRWARPRSSPPREEAECST